MSGNNEKSAATPKGDKELDDLLDSALQDMAPTQMKKRNSIGGSSIVPADDGVEWNPSENVWSEEFLQQAAATFESNMASLLSSLKGVPEDSISQDQIAATFHMMAEAAAQVMKPGEAPPAPVDDTTRPKAFNDVNAAIAQTLESLNSNSDNLQTPFNDEDLTNMFSGLNLAKEGTSTNNMFIPFMQGMMQSLLSKEVLYPSLKDIVDKYPKWLVEHKDVLDNDEFERYKKQNKLMGTVCAELETEKETDDEQTKNKRFERVLKLMQQMQELGQPPAELGGEMPPIAPPGDMADPSQCKPM